MTIIDDDVTTSAIYSITEAKSAAFAVLRGTSRRVLATIEAKIARHGDNTPISHMEFADHNIGTTALRPALRELAALGFIIIGKGGKKVQTFTRSMRWRNIVDLETAKRISATARAPMPTKPRLISTKAPKVPAVAKEPRKMEPVRAAAPASRPLLHNRVVGDAPQRPITLPKLPWPTAYPTREWRSDEP